MSTRFQLDPNVVNPGVLRHTIQIQVQSNAPDTVTGAPGTSWATVLTTTAAIRGLTTREAFQADQFSALVSHVITIRWPGTGVGIRGGMQVVFGSRIFKLQTVDNVLERNRVMLLRCLEIDGVQS